MARGSAVTSPPGWSPAALAPREGKRAPVDSSGTCVPHAGTEMPLDRRVASRSRHARLRCHWEEKYRGARI
jgi:hypothetical protein